MAQNFRKADRHQINHVWSFLRKFRKINIVSYLLGVLFLKGAAILSNAFSRRVRNWLQVFIK